MKSTTVFSWKIMEPGEELQNVVTRLENNTRQLIRQSLKWTSGNESSVIWKSSTRSTEGTSLQSG